MEKIKEPRQKNHSLLDYYGFTLSDQKKYPVISGILKELTPERIKKEIEEVNNVVLPPELQKWVKEYEKVGKRDGYIWKWAYKGWQIFTLSCVEEKNKNFVVVSKIYSTILNALIDDIADSMQNDKLLLEASNIIFFTNKHTSKSLNTQDAKYLLLIRKIWNLLNKNIKQYPEYKKFKDIFIYDYRQFLNTMQYSYLINKNPFLINLIEHEIYSPHNMQMIIGGTVDLMFSPNFNVKDLGMLRIISWNTQQMGRIGNLVATWTDEISDDKDFTSGIFAYAIDNGIIKSENLLKKEKIKKIIKNINESEAEKYYLKKWEDCYNNIFNLNRNIKSFSVKKILLGSKKFLKMHLASRGLEI